MLVVRDIYLSLLFLFAAMATLAPYLGVPLPEFVYDAGAGESAELPVSVALYAACLLTAIAAFVLRVLPKPKGATHER